MKNIKSYIATAAIATALLSAVSCKKDFYTKANVNPNSPTNVTPATLLTGVEVSLGYTLDGDMSRFGSIIIQQTTGVSRQSAAYETYLFTNQDPESNWDNWYDDVMENDYQLMLLASKSGDHEYYGIAEIIMAYSLQQTVDCWGSIPYSQAFLGNANLAPSYDQDKALYDTAMSLTARGIANINAAASDAVLPSTDDIMYAGVGAQWIKFAHAIRARLYIHQTKHVVAPSTDANCDSAMAEAGRSFASNADDAQVPFGASATNNNPWYQFNTQRADIEFAYTNYTPGYYGTFADSLLKQSDPRFSFLIDSVNEPITGNGLTNYDGGPSAAVVLSTYAEMQFILAEATLRTAGIGAAAQADYTNGITANMNKMGVPAASITTFTTSGTQATLPITAAAAIMQNAWQENVALYLNPEAWTLWRRCNWNIVPVSNIAGGGVPRRFLYPQSELNNNASHVPSATQVTPAIFWDN